ncbi:MAG: ferritin-like domain-containing protein [Sphingobacteriales bacterium]|nr:MAG: ferritin-like domain-containing protein [Sphingobacteriales bacterium]
MKELLTKENTPNGFSRRRFLAFSGGLVGATALLSACHNEPDDYIAPTDGAVDLGSGDVGILNYAYALEQLEAAFYTKVIDSPYSGMSPDEKALLSDIRDHEIAHRNFFKAALGKGAIQDLEVNFEKINFGDRGSVLATAKAFEDLGVSAYNGAGQLIVTPDYLVLAGKIVSVEARHAAYIRDLLSNGSFADSSVIDANGLDKSRMPSEVLAIAGAYIKTKINANNLPK